MQNDPERKKISDLAERIRRAEAARNDRDAGGQKEPENGPGIAGMLRLGSDFAATILTATAMGWGVDRVFDTAPWFMLAFMFVGFFGGAVGVWRACNPKEQEAPEGQGGDVKKKERSDGDAFSD